MGEKSRVRIRSMMLSAKTCGQHNMAIDSVSTIRFIVLISVVLSFLVGRGSLLIQCQEFEILFYSVYKRVYIDYMLRLY